MRAAAENKALLKRVNNKKSTHGLNSMRGCVFWHSQPDSNRCYRRERAVS